MQADEAEHLRIAGPATVGAVLAVALPSLIAYNVPPSATFFNQAAAFVGWGVFLMLLSPALPRRLRPRSQGLDSLLTALALLLLAAFAAPFWAARDLGTP